jgi:RND family efflux transporter MFP subunit
MPDRGLAAILDQVRRTAAVSGVSDAQLLARFTRDRDEAAFELLVWRYSRLVFGVCRRILGNDADAEDAFQAAFLALARKAGRINKPEAVASWLYQVAYRVALTARGKRSRRAVRERRLNPEEAVPAPPDSVTGSERQELRTILDEELSQLPQKFRGPVVLCYLEGQTVDEAAVQLGCPRGTVASRLARARERLRSRLTRRGLAIAAGASLLASEPATAASPSLILRTAQVAVGDGSQGIVPARVAALTGEVLRAMFLRKLAGGAVFLMALLVLGTGGGLAVHFGARAAGPQARDDGDQRKDDAPRVQKPVRQPDQEKVALGTVQVSRPVQREVTPYQDFTGRLEAVRTVEVRPRRDGRLDKVLVKPGAEVKEGDVLFELDNRAEQANLESAQADLLAVEAMRSLAAKEIERLQQLATKGVASSQDVTRERINLLNIEAKRKVAAANLDRAKLNLEATRITAPTAGTVGRILVDPGNDVVGGGRGGTVLTTITLLDPIGLAFDVDERSFLRFQRLQRAGKIKVPGSPLLMALADEKGFPHKGTFDGFDDRFDPRFGTIRAHGTFPNPDRLLLPGMFARVGMTFGKPRRVLEISPGALSGSDVLVVNDRGRLEVRQVRTGQMDGDLRVIEEGLQPNDWVVITQGRKYSGAGDRVESQRVPMPGGPPDSKKK